MATGQSVEFNHRTRPDSDPRMSALLYKYGFRGYGWYWAIVEEAVRQPNHKYPAMSRTYNVIAFILHEPVETIEEFINDCCNEFVIDGRGIFEMSGGYLHAPDITEQMERQQAKADKARCSALARFSKHYDASESADAPMTRAERLARAKQLGNHTKEEWEQMLEFFSYTCVKCGGKNTLKRTTSFHFLWAEATQSRTFSRYALPAMSAKQMTPPTTGFRIVPLMG